MLGDLHDLALGPVTPAVASIFAALGCLLGAILAARARTCTGGSRLRYVAYATISVAGAGIWMPAVVATLGLQVDGSVVRLDPRWLGLSLVAAIAATAIALVLLCYGRRRADRLIAGAIVLVSAIAASAELMLRSVATGGRVTDTMPYTGMGLGVAAGAAVLLSLLLGAAPSLRRATLMSLAAGLSLTAVHVVAAAGLTVGPGADGTIPADEVGGLAPLRFGLPAVVMGGVLMAMMWYFTVGTATRRDLSLVFDPAGADQIDPWMVEQVRSRVALSSTAFAAVPGWGGDVWAEATVAVRSIPLLGGSAASAFSQGVRDYRAQPRPEPTPTALDRDDAEPPTTDWPAEPPTLDSPQWRPIPGWDVENADRSVLTPAPEGTARSASHWDELDRSHPLERNEQRAVTRPRATNSRQGDFPSRSPQPQLVPPANEPAWEPTVVDGPPPPLPRRNTGR